MRRYPAHSRFRFALSWIMCATIVALNTAVAVFALLLYAVTP